MELLVTAAPSMGADSLLDISAAHIDGCLYHGRAGVDLAVSLTEGETKVVVPTTLNVSSLDLLHPDLYRGDPESAAASRSLMDAYLAMGCQPTWTCAPYQLPERPGLGQQVAWGESNAIVFANSVLGARTNRYGDFFDICCAITGRAPSSGLHTDEGRLATVVVEVECPTASSTKSFSIRFSVTPSARWSATKIAVLDRPRRPGRRGPTEGIGCRGRIIGLRRHVPCRRRHSGGTVTPGQALGGREPRRGRSSSGSRSFRRRERHWGGMAESWRR